MRILSNRIDLNCGLLSGTESGSISQEKNISIITMKAGQPNLEY